MSFISVLLNVILLLFIPLSVGNGVCKLFGFKKNIINFYFYGLFSTWAYIQLISVPLILLKTSFTFVFVLICLYLLIMSGYGLYKNNDFKIKLYEYKSKDKIAIVSLIIFVLFFMSLSVRYQHIDEDDSRFVVNAVEMLATNKMMLTNPATGEDLPGFVLPDSDKDVVSPWAVYIAFASKITNTRTVVEAHTVIPLALILLSVCVFYLVSEKLLGKDITLNVMFVMLMLMMMLYGYSHLWTMITMYMDRLWQGKSVVASIGIPAMFVVLFDYYDDLNDIKKVILVDLGMCLFSGMGVVIGAIIIGCFAFGYAISKRNLNVMFYLLLVAIINTIYFLLEINI